MVEGVPEKPISRTPVTITLEPNAALREHIEKLVADNQEKEPRIRLTLAGVVPPLTNRWEFESS